jgi:glutathionylspermidine synthase
LNAAASEAPAASTGRANKMQRIATEVRSDWEKKVEEQGLIFHHTQGGVYWDESAYYRFTSSEVDTLEAATNELQRICLEAGQNIIDHKRYAELGIPDFAVPAIESSWNLEPPAIYGRMDLAYDGMHPPKLLEYNADTPTALLESAVVQWYWLEDKFPHSDQFNSIHERLIAKWKELKDYLSPKSALYFTHLDDPQGEDAMTATYLRDTAQQGGLETSGILIKDIGWDSRKELFVDLAEAPMYSIFKLYPWEWLIHEKFGPNLLKTYDQVSWMEPIWKMLFANKGILPILWELNPNHPNLLEAYFDGPRTMTGYVRKPKMSREGANITLITQGGNTETGGDYGEEGYIYQALAQIPTIDGRRPILGSWLVDGEAAGMGIRESAGPITDNLSTFVPHLFDK